VDADLRPLGQSTRPARPACFANALVQNIVSGHSAVLNPAGHALIRKVGMPQGIAYHDWWLYQLITGVGGQVMIDGAPVLDYRQHGGNVMGAHRGAQAFGDRVGMVLRAEYGQWIATNTCHLARCRHLLTPANQTLLTQVQTALSCFGPVCALKLAQAQVHRQSAPGSALLYLAAALGRI